MYTIAPYYLSKTIVEVPIALIQPMLFAVIVYFGVGLTVTVKQFFLFYIILLVLTFSA